MDRFRKKVEAYFEENTSRSVSSLRKEVTQLRHTLQEDERSVAEQEGRARALTQRLTQLTGENKALQASVAEEEAQKRRKEQSLTEWRQAAFRQEAQLQVGNSHWLALTHSFVTEPTKRTRKGTRFFGETRKRNGIKVSPSCRTTQASFSS